MKKIKNVNYSKKNGEQTKAVASSTISNNNKSITGKEVKSNLTNNAALKIAQSNSKIIGQRTSRNSNKI